MTIYFRKYLNSYLIVLHSVAKSCPALCDSMDSILPVSSVLHYFPELAQIHVHWVRDAVWSSHPLPPPSPFAFNLSQHQGLFKWVDFCIKILELISFSISSFNENSELIYLELTSLITLQYLIPFTKLISKWLTDLDVNLRIV